MNKYVMKYNNRTGCHIICVANNHTNNTPSNNNNMQNDNNNNAVYSFKK